MAKEKFNLKSLLNERSKVGVNEETHEEGQEDFEVKLLDVFDLEPSRENFYNISEIEDMKQSIELLGIEQNLIVKKISEGKYKLLAGHRRRLASIKLVEEGKQKYRLVPCRIKNTTNEILNKLTMIMTNSTQRELKDWEKMRQVLEIEELVIELKKEAKIPGRTRDLLAEILNTSPSQLGRYKAIQNNLSEELMEEFKNDNIGFSVAYEVAGLSENGQQKALELLIENSDLILNDVKQIKKAEEEAKPISGQVELFHKNNEVSEDYEVENEPEKTNNSIEPEQNKLEVNKKIDEIENEELESQEEPLEEHKEEKKSECNFCSGEESISTHNGTFVMNLEPTTNQVRIIGRDTGEIDIVPFVWCPICGKLIGKSEKEST
ncbi:ParB/RepB/Spo0J family partition protein [Clostridium tunisiense]|uniref:ParB/RepB/Spo0J family partition protein n=1 Tax=Clostridium tunisiense TaxID=219748 RepID=UPI0002E101B6|nr:ParB N-terminal domain-containing protein [Clostridium tunisiense]